MDNTIGQGVGVALGQQKSFSWAELAGAALANAAFPENLDAQGRPQPIARDFDWSNVATDSLTDFEHEATQQSVKVLLQGHGKIDLANVAADSFGIALGNSIAGEIEFQVYKSNLGQAGEDQYDYEISQGKSSAEALQIAQYADQQALQMMLTAPIGGRSLSGATSSTSSLPISYSSNLAYGNIMAGGGQPSITTYAIGDLTCLAFSDHGKLETGSLVSRLDSSDQPQG